MSKIKVMDGYIRVSRKMGREGPGYISPDVQRDAIARWAEYKGITIGEWLKDEDWSGGTHDRPALVRGVERALARQTDGIVSWKIDRFSRTTEDGLRDLRRLQTANARLAFVVEDIDTGTTYGKMVYTMLLAISEAFLENIKASWIEAKTRALARGAYITRTPIGYQNQPDGTITPDPQFGPIIAEAFRLAATDGLQPAIDYLNGAVPSRVWTTAKTRRVFASRVYLGHTHHGDIVILDSHKPLVTRLVWEGAQTVAAPRQAAGNFPLSRLATCASCGGAMVGARGGGGRRTYRCSSSLSLSRVTCEEPSVITAAILEDHVRSQAREELQGLNVSIGGASEAVAEAEAKLEMAEAELDAFAADTTLRRSLGGRFQLHLDARVTEVDEARAAYRALALTAQRTLNLSIEDLLSADDPVLFRAGLSGIFSSIAIRRARRGAPVEDRVLLVPVDPDRTTGKAST